MNNKVDLGAVLFVLAVGVVIFVIAVLVWAMILRAAVSLTNKIFGPQTGGEYDEHGNLAGGRPRPAITEPGFGKACLIVLVTGILNVAIQYAISELLARADGGAGLGGKVRGGRGQQELQQIAVLISLPLGFFIAWGVRIAALPSTFLRAFVVVLFEYLIAFVILSVVVAGVVGAMFALGMMK